MNVNDWWSGKRASRERNEKGRRETRDGDQQEDDRQIQEEAAARSGCRRHEYLAGSFGALAFELRGGRTQAVLACGRPGRVRARGGQGASSGIAARPRMLRRIWIQECLPGVQ